MIIIVQYLFSLFHTTLLLVSHSINQLYFLLDSTHMKAFQKALAHHKLSRHPLLVF